MKILIYEQESYNVRFYTKIANLMFYSAWGEKMYQILQSKNKQNSFTLNFCHVDNTYQLKQKSYRNFNKS